MWDDLPDELQVAVAAWLSAPRDLLQLGATCHRAHGLPTDDLWRSICAARWAAWPSYALTPQREAHLAQRHPTMGWKARYRHFEADARRQHITQEELRELGWHFNFTPFAGGRGRATLKQARFTATKLHVPSYPPLDYQLTWVPQGLDEIDPRVASFLLTQAAAAGVDISDGAAGSGSGEGGEGGASGSGAAVGDEQQAVSAIQRALSSLLATHGREHATEAASAARRQTLRISNFPPHWIRRLDDTREWVIYNDNVTLVSCPPGTKEPNPSYDERGFLTDLSGGEYTS